MSDQYPPQYPGSNEPQYPASNETPHQPDYPSQSMYPPPPPPPAYRPTYPSQPLYPPPPPPPAYQPTYPSQPLYPPPPVYQPAYPSQPLYPPPPPLPLGYAPVGVAPVVVRNSRWAIASLVLGIIGLCTFYPGILAVICGHLAHNGIKKSDGLIQGKRLATAGLVLGYAETAFIVMILAIDIITAAVGSTPH